MENTLKTLLDINEQEVARRVENIVSDASSSTSGLQQSSGECPASKRKKLATHKTFNIHKMADEDIQKLVTEFAETWTSEEEEDSSEDETECHSLRDSGEPLIDLSSSVNIPKPQSGPESPAVSSHEPEQQPLAGSSPVTPHHIPFAAVPQNTTQFAWGPEKILDEVPFLGINRLTDPPTGGDPADYFHKVFTKGFFDLIIEETNFHAVEILSQNENQKALITYWKDIDEDSFKMFLGLRFHTMTVRTNRLPDYWNRDEKFNFPFFQSRMSRDRFMSIYNTLHFGRNPDEDDNIPTDPLYKIRPLVDLFNSTMNDLYYPGKQLCIDESMVLFKGRIKFRMYLKGKKHRFGIKLYMLTEPSGIVLKFIVYSGAEDENLGGKGHAEEVVNELLRDHLNVNHSVYMDNYYNSVGLASQLIKNKCYCTGTLRSNRKHNPPAVTSYKLKKGDCICQGELVEPINVLKWKDKREVMLISTEFGSKLVDVNTRRGNIVRKPQSVSFYNKNMGGIDKLDQLLSYHPNEHKNIIWYRKLGIHIFQVMLLNSYLLYNQYCHQKMDLYKYHNAIVDYLCKKNKEAPQKKTSSISIEKHFPKYTDFVSADKTGRRKQLRCRECSLLGKSTKVIVVCPDCPDKPGLCLENCFQNYHRRNL